jgi:ABC-type multidrug transport system fused ATPase/permease subunit
MDVPFPLTVPNTWPREGRLQVKGLTARYEEDLPDVLHDVTFEALAAERIGIVGRT